ncbi:uncharacterized protein [Dysidea avara]|uniref:uncharacterized protein n=1 Tax=Dysidea avara TaxID=196820 RepID=UPI00331E55A0
MKTVAVPVIVLTILLPTITAGTVVNMVDGLFSKTTVSDGLQLKATTTFQPIHALTTSIHIKNPSSVFVHYGITFHSSNKDFYSKLQINSFNAGSLVHTGNQLYKTATGFWMENLNPGQYTIEVHYKSPVNIVMGVADWQAAVLHMFWAEDSRAVSSGIKCYPEPTSINAYNYWGILSDLETVLHLQSTRVVLAAYQFSSEMATPSHVVTALGVNGFHQHSSSFLNGDIAFLNLHGVWAERRSQNYMQFNVLYRTPTTLSFTDCKEDYKNNKNLYAMIFPPSCNVVTVNPKGNFAIGNSNVWAPTDVSHSLSLSKQSHVFIMYQFAGPFGGKTIVMRLSINSVPQKHTQSLMGEMTYGGMFGMWQGVLNSGTHKITLDYRGNAKAGLQGVQLWQTRAITAVYC